MELQNGLQVVPLWSTSVGRERGDREGEKENKSKKTDKLEREKERTFREGTYNQNQREIHNIDPSALLMNIIVIFPNEIQSSPLTRLRYEKIGNNYLFAQFASFLTLFLFPLSKLNILLD